jgi:hypothetical protein
MDKVTQEGMKNLDVTMTAADLVKNASSKEKAEWSEKQQETKVKDKRS